MFNFKVINSIQKTNKIISGMTPKETIAFGFQKQLDTSYVSTLGDNASRYNETIITKLKRIGASKQLMQTAENQSPLKYLRISA